MINISESCYLVREMVTIVVNSELSWLNKVLV